MTYFVIDALGRRFESGHESQDSCSSDGRVNVRVFSLVALLTLAEWSSWSAHKFHKLEVAGSSPASALKKQNAVGQRILRSISLGDIFFWASPPPEARLSLLPFITVAVVKGYFISYYKHKICNLDSRALHACRTVFF